MCRNNKFKISGKKWDEEYELPDGSHSKSDILGCFKYIIKKHETLSGKLPVEKYVNRIHNRLIVKIKSGYHLEVLIRDTVKLLGATEEKITKSKNSENVQRNKKYQNNK